MRNRSNAETWEALKQVSYGRGLRRGWLCGALVGLGLGLGIASQRGCTNESIDLSPPCAACVAGERICVNEILECECGSDGFFYCTDCRISCGIIGYPGAACVEGSEPGQSRCDCRAEP